MATKEYSRVELEKVLDQKYKGKYISFTYPGYQQVHGICNRVAFDHNGMVILSIGEKRYEVSLESLRDCTRVLRN